MIREEKLISIAVLTVLLYALGILLDASFFLIPFPLFDLIFFAVFVQFLFWNRNALKGYIWFYFSAVLLQVFCNPLFLGTALSSAHLNQLDDFLTSILTYVIDQKELNLFQVTMTLVPTRTLL